MAIILLRSIAGVFGGWGFLSPLGIFVGIGIPIICSELLIKFIIYNIYNILKKKIISMNRYTLLMTIAECTGIETKAICGKRRNKEIVTARHLFFYFGRVYFGFRLVEMATLIGCHHASVIHAIDKVSDMIETGEETYCRYFEAIRDKITTERQFTLFVPYSVNLVDLLNCLSDFPEIRVNEQV